MKKLAIVGGGPAALMTLKNLLEKNLHALTVEIFENSEKLGVGMPYSREGAGKEHVTNVSAHELPELPMPLAEWIKTLPDATLQEFDIDAENFNEKKVLPRLLFGQYLNAQFEAVLEKCKAKNFEVTQRLNTKVVDISYDKSLNKVIVKSVSSLKNDKEKVVTTQEFDSVVICSGHEWPKSKEKRAEGYFDSPYPPSKLVGKKNQKIGIRGSSLTAVDAIRTLARNNGKFEKCGSELVFKPATDAENFEIVMHSRNGLLPCVRIHMEEPEMTDKDLIPEEEIQQNREENDGFLQLDFLFEKGFKEPLKKRDKEFYKQIKGMTLESFVEAMMKYREKKDSFELLEEEYAEAKKSIREEKPIHWKEALGALSFAMNYPAKYLSAEDMLRLKKHLMPLISVVIAFLPQESCKELLALHNAGKLHIKSDGDGTISFEKQNKIKYIAEDGTESGEYETFVDCIGQPHLNIEDFPFKSLLEEGTVSGAFLKFKSVSEGQKQFEDGNKDVVQVNGEYHLKVPGAAITDDFQVVEENGKENEHIFLLAVPYIGGYNPDYSGLDFCEEASTRVANSLEKSLLIKR